MSNGGSFLVLTNEGKSDNNLLAPEMLKCRIEKIRAARKAHLAAKEKQARARGLTLEDLNIDTNTDPTLGDIEQTHILFMNAGFKPFVSMGFEYHKQSASNGSGTTLGTEMSFEIPQFGDFWTDMVLRQQMGACYSSTWTTPTAGTTTTTAHGYTYHYPAATEDWDGSAINASLGVSSYRLVSPFGDVIADNTANAGRNLVRYCEYPGERLVEKIEMDINSNPLDAYGYMSSVFHRLFQIGTDKLEAYKRLVGQQTDVVGYSGPKRGYVDDTDMSGTQTQQTTVTTNVAYTAGVDGIQGQQVGPSTHDTTLTFTDASFPDGEAVLSNAADTDATASDTTIKNQVVHQDKLVINNGPQTPKYRQPVTEIWTPIHLWSRDIGVAVPSSAIPSGNRFLRVTYAAVGKVLHEFPGVFMRQQLAVRSLATGAAVTPAWAATVPGTPATDIWARSPDVIVNYRPYFQTGTITGVSSTTPAFKISPELYINNVFVNPDIHTIFVKRVGFYLIRVHREQKITGIQAGKSERFNSFKWPIEYVLIGFLPDHNVDTTKNPNVWRDWHRFCKVYDAKQDYRPEIGVRVPTSTEAVTDGAAAVMDVFEVGYSSIGQIVPNTFPVEVPVIDTLECKAHEVILSKAYVEGFYSNYIPYNFGQGTITSPSSKGAMMINFSQYPGQRQPSGHINLSRAREFYITWTTSFASANTSMTLHATGCAINFLLVTDGTANLRYTT